MNIFTEILHAKTDTSDKVYIVEVNEINSQYIVTATWGRRDAPRLSSQIKGEFTHQRWAVDCATKLINDKKRGKDKYQKAAVNLQMPGFKRNKVAAVDVYVDSSTTSSKAMIQTSSVPAVRKIKL